MMDLGQLHKTTEYKNQGTPLFSDADHYGKRPA